MTSCRFRGLNIWKAAPLVIEKLREHGCLFATHDITHSYSALLAP
jgi:isoleucyl-tRNA synthetase